MITDNSRPAGAVPDTGLGVRSLLEQARGGDARARDRLFACCRSYLVVVARSRVEGWLQAKVDASDVVQQSLLEAHRDFARFQGAGEAEWLGWLRRIVERNAHDFVRHYRGAACRDVGREVGLRDPADSAAAGAPEPADRIDSPSQLMIQRERHLLLADAMMQLSEDHREVIVLRNIQQLEFEEIGRRMGRTRPAVQMLWMRALQKLKALLPPADAGG